MKSVLISIHPEWCEKICHVIGKEETGKPIYEKRIEVRKSAPKEVPFKAYIYSTRPKKYYKCGAVSTSDELLWLANGKVEMGDGFKFWADGDEYQCLNGHIIGEFICDKIYPIKAERYDGGSAECSRKSVFTLLPAEEHNALLNATRLTNEEIFDYLGGEGKWGYGWHISDLKIYDTPKELSEFYSPCPIENKDCENCIRYGKPHKWYFDEKQELIYCTRRLSRPPQSWQYVDEVKE